MPDFNKDMSVDDILKEMRRNNGVPAQMYAGSAFLQYKLQEELFEEQKTFNKKQLSVAFQLVVVTWVLAIATSAVALFTILKL